jgi:hypothetical protein
LYSVLSIDDDTPIKVVQQTTRSPPTNGRVATPPTKSVLRANVVPPSRISPAKPTAKVAPTTTTTAVRSRQPPVPVRSSQQSSSTTLRQYGSDDEDDDDEANGAHFCCSISCQLF